MSNNLSNTEVRLVRRDGSTNIDPIGLPRWWEWRNLFNFNKQINNLYHCLLNVNWQNFLLFIFLLFFFSNIGFTIIYWLLKTPIIGIFYDKDDWVNDFINIFFFSVQTMTTIGYGTLSPNSRSSNAIVVLEVFVGWLLQAIITGLAFARFSRPQAQVLFSNIAVITNYNGIPSLMFRVANQRHNQILQAEISVSLFCYEITLENESIPQFYQLNLVRNKSPIFDLTWRVIHQIDANSPLYGITPEELVQKQMEIIVTFTGLDETVSQTIYARHSFTASEIQLNRRFVDIISGTNGRRQIDYVRFHETIPG